MPASQAPTPRPRSWISIACEPEVVRRSLRVAAVAGTLVGIVSIGDVVKGQLEDLQLEVGVLRDYARARP